MHEEIETHVAYIYDNIIKPLSEPGDKDIPPDLITDVEKLERYDYSVLSSLTDL
jgi:hypothetical protein